MQRFRARASLMQFPLDEEDDDDDDDDFLLTRLLRLSGASKSSGPGNPDSVARSETPGN